MSLTVNKLALAAGTALLLSVTAAHAERPDNTQGVCEGNPCGGTTTIGGGGNGPNAPQCQAQSREVEIGTNGTSVVLNYINVPQGNGSITLYSLTGGVTTPNQNVTVNITPGSPEETEASCIAEVCSDSRLPAMGLSCSPQQQPAVTEQPRTATPQRQTIPQTVTPPRVVIATHVMADCGNTDALRQDLIFGTDAATFVRRQTQTVAERADIIGQQLTNEQIGEMAFCNAYAVIHEPTQAACAFNTNENGELVIGADAIRFAETGEGCEIATTPESVICEPNAESELDLNGIARRLEALEAERDNFCTPTVEQGASLLNGVNSAQLQLAAFNAGIEIVPVPQGNGLTAIYGMVAHPVPQATPAVPAELYNAPALGMPAGRGAPAPQ